MVTVSCTATTAVFEVDGLDKRWALRSRREIPLAYLTGVRADPSVATGWWHGLRLGGTNDRVLECFALVNIAIHRNHSIGFAAGVANGFAARMNPAVLAIAATHSIFGVEVRRYAGNMILQAH